MTLRRPNTRLPKAALRDPPLLDPKSGIQNGSMTLRAFAPVSWDRRS
jgi:hypothetical protein